MYPSAGQTYGGMKQVLAVSIGLFLVFLDTTIVNIALPDISKDLRIELGTASWIIDAFVVTVSMWLVAFGKIADIFGSFRTYMAGLLIFMTASLLCGIAPNVTCLIVFRVLQGIGAVSVIPSSLYLVRSAVPPEKTGTAMGIWGGVGALAIALGPSLGGVVTEYLNWRWIFFINIPVVLISTPLTLLVFKRHKDQRAPFHLDFPGILTFGACLFFVTYAILQGHDAGWGSWRIILSFALGAIFAVLFLVVERRAKYPLIRKEILRNRIFVGGMAANFLSGVLLMGTLILLPVYFTEIKDFDILKSSVMITPLSAIMLVVAPLIGRLIDKVNYFVPMLLGYGFAIVGFYLMSRLTITDSNGYLILVMAIAGTGIGILMVTSVTVGTASVAEQDATLGSAVYATARNMGGAVGVALFVSLTLSFSHGAGTDAAAAGVGAAEQANDLVRAMNKSFASGLILSVLFGLSLPLLRMRKSRTALRSTTHETMK